ncbi:MAG: type ISP restriction/modification enzyme [Planctomycetota bacterium]|nr:type ISP restriction/modification enzyme [Planctomycetota bacterium]
MPPTDFKLRWSELHQEFKARLPALDEGNAREIQLAISTLVRMKNRDTLTRMMELAPLGDPVFQFVCRLIDQEPQLIQACDRLLPETRYPDDSASILMELIQLTQGRKELGVFYTPRPLARSVIQTALQQMDESGWEPGEAQILEPSAGTGIFSSEFSRILLERKDPGQVARILSHLTCVDLSPAAMVVAQYRLLSLLTKEQVPLDRPELPRFLVANTLTAEPGSIYDQIGTDPSTVTVRQLLREEPTQLVLGNPPFGSLTQPTGAWIKKLLHGEGEGAAGRVSYYEVNGEPVGQRKSWLHDLYVQFVRYAQWLTQRQPQGCLAMVLNAGFLSNLSFRGMRFQLLKAFPVMEIADFGGDLRNEREAGDENLFRIETGIATLVATRSPVAKEKRVYHQLRGSAEDKKRWCEQQAPRKESFRTNRRKVEAVPPAYRFDFIVPSALLSAYQRGWSIEEIFLQKWSAPVTARDHLVIDSSREKLIDKIHSFLDPEKTDDQVRKAFFPRPRSKRYPPGDSRGWKLGEARYQLRKLPWQEMIQSCDYRPFDRRYVLWSPLMIDWPRSGLADAMKLPGNYCLVARKQAPPGLHYSYFWSSSSLPMDGILRSDNRGNEYCFPLWVPQDSGPVCNLSDHFLDSLRSSWGIQSIDPLMVYDLLIALFHSHQYRTRFGPLLSTDFPRVFIPSTFQIASDFAAIGGSIRRTQSCSETGPLPENGESGPIPISGPGTASRIPMFQKPAYRDGELELGPGEKLPISEAMWNFRIGSHQVLRKFCGNRLKSDQHAKLKEDTEQVGQRIRSMLECCERLDQFVETQGGFRALFEMRGTEHAVTP